MCVGASRCGDGVRLLSFEVLGSENVQVWRIGKVQSVAFKSLASCWLPLLMNHFQDSCVSCLAHLHEKSWAHSALLAWGMSADWATDSSLGLNDQSPILGRNWTAMEGEHRRQIDLGEQRSGFQCCSSCCHCWCRHCRHKNCSETRHLGVVDGQMGLEVLERQH